MSDCGRYLMLLLSEGCKDNMVYYVDLQGLPDGPTGLLEPVCVVDKFEADYEASRPWKICAVLQMLCAKLEPLPVAFFSLNLCASACQIVWYNIFVLKLSF